MIYTYTNTWYIDLRNGSIFSSGNVTGAEQYQTGNECETFDTEDAYRERYKELTGEYPPIELE